MDRLSTGEKVVGASSLLLLILSMLPLWAKFEAEVEGLSGFDSSQRFSGWSAATPFMAKLAFLLALAALVLVVVRAMAVDVNLPFPAGLTYLALGGLATLLLLITLLTGPVGDQGTESVGGASFEYSRGLAMLIGWLVAAGIAAGGYLHMQNESPAVTTGTGTPLGAPPGGTAPTSTMPTGSTGTTGTAPTGTTGTAPTGTTGTTGTTPTAPPPSNQPPTV